MINQVTISDIKSRIDIEEVISDFVTLKRKGQNLWACCPFHNEKTPSFSVSPGKGFYKCFGCGKGGDSIDFIMEIEKISYVEALRFLAGKYGIEIEEEEQTEDQLKEQSERESLFIVLNYAKEFFVNNLMESAEGKTIGQAYFKERNIEESIINGFELGYCLDQWDALYKQATSDGFIKEILEKAGLLIIKDDRIYDRFRGRVVFPIHNISGRIVAFGARALKKDDKPKYINSPETPVYQKSEIVYGLHRAKQQIRQLNNCYLVEGYTDVTRLHQIGIQNVVASSGTSLTEGQINQIGRFGKQITVLYDGDMAGIKAAIRGIDMILKNGLDVKIVLFPEGEDPDSYVQKLGETAFQDFLEDNVRDFIHFKTDLIASEAGNDPLKKAEGIKETVSSISCIPDMVKRTIYIQEASKILKLDEKILVAEMNKVLLIARSTYREKSPIQEQTDALKEQPQAGWDINMLIAHQEKESMRLLLKYGFSKVYDDSSLYQFIFDELAEIEFITPVYREIIDIFKHQLEDGITVDADYLIEHGSQEVRKTVIDLVFEQHHPSTHWHEKYKIYVPDESEKSMLEHVTYTNILRLKQRVVRKLIEENLLKLKDASEDDDQTNFQLLHSELKKTENEIARELGNVILK